MVSKLDITFSFKKHCVQETSNGLSFPSAIARPRTNLRKISIVVVSCLFLFLAYILASGDRFLYLVSAASSMIFVMGCVELITRICAIFEERRHIRARYKDQMLNLLHDVFRMSLLSMTVLVASIFTLVLIYFASRKNPFDITFNANWQSGFAIMMSIVLFRRVLKLEHSPLNESLQFDELQGCDYGSGMAHSFFHGYLRLMLPHTGMGNNKGIKEYLCDYEAKMGINVAVYKLLILIPMSQHCPPSLENDFSPSIEISKELESKEMDRAGVKNRIYKNSVYKITTQSGKKIYVSAEYATPVKTLAEVMNQNTLWSNLYKKHSKEILLNFYLTIRNLLREDDACRDLCEVIYYDDKKKNGDFLDVGGIILSRLEQIAKKNQ